MRARLRIAMPVMAGVLALSPTPAPAALPGVPAAAEAPETSAPAGGAQQALQAVAPHYLRLQYSGFIGWLSVGAGYSFWRGRVEPELAYGYVPASIGGVPIHTVGQKTTLAPARLRLGEGTHLFPVLAGYSANVTLGKNYFLISPEQYPYWDYYWPTALRVVLFTGTSVTRTLPPESRLRAVGFTAELGTHDAWWWYYFRTDRIGVTDIFSLALAMQGYF